MKLKYATMTTAEGVVLAVLIYLGAAMLVWGMAEFSRRPGEKSLWEKRGDPPRRLISVKEFCANRPHVHGCKEVTK